jgi:hypothetical protein
VYLNGLLLHSGVGNDFTTSGQSIIMNYAPLPGDTLAVDYRAI